MPHCLIDLAAIDAEKGAGVSEVRVVAARLRKDSRK